MRIYKNLEVTCSSQQNVSFTLKTQEPFELGTDTLKLLPGQKETIRVSFDPSFKSDRMSGKQAGKITFSPDNHPHKEIVDLVGEVCFPNI